MAKILLVEDDSRLLDQLTRWLLKENNAVETADTGEKASQLLEKTQFDVIVLDWNLPELNGLNVLKRFRARGGITPIIFLTGQSDRDSKRAGFDSGADDYLTKPFEPEELSARIRALLRRPAGLLSKTISVGSVVLQTDSKLVFVNGKPVKLGKMEFALLEFLMRHSNQCFSSKQLMDSVWTSDTNSTEDAVRSCIRQLRGKITSDDGSCILATVKSAGYTVSLPESQNEA